MISQKDTFWMDFSTSNQRGGIVINSISLRWKLNRPLMQEYINSCMSLMLLLKNTKQYQWPFCSSAEHALRLDNCQMLGSHIFSYNIIQHSSKMFCFMSICINNILACNIFSETLIMKLCNSIFCKILNRACLKYLSPVLGKICDLHFKQVASIFIGS